MGIVTIDSGPDREEGPDVAAADMAEVLVKIDRKYAPEPAETDDGR